MLKTEAGEIIGDSGPAQRIFRSADLKSVTGYNRTYIYELIKVGKFPAPIRLGPNAVGWLESDIVAWQRERIAERDATEK